MSSEEMISRMTASYDYQASCITTIFRYLWNDPWQLFVCGVVFSLLEAVIVFIQLSFHHTYQVLPKSQYISKISHNLVLPACHKALVQRRTFQRCDLGFCFCLSETQKPCNLGTLVFDLHPYCYLKIYVHTHYILLFFLFLEQIH